MTKTVVLKVSFAKNDGVTKVQRPAAVPAPPAEPGRVARLLALAYRVEQLIDDGVLPYYREAARRLGISPAHLTHYIALLDLGVPIQEDILLGRLDASERSFREVATLPHWSAQRVSECLAVTLRSEIGLQSGSI